VRAFTAGYGARTRLGERRLYVWKVKPYAGALALEAGVPGQILGVGESGVVVQAGDGPIVLTKTSVGKEGPDLLTALGGALGGMPIVLG
jgi:methionyl-tRNA formyltransferase